MLSRLQISMFFVCFCFAGWLVNPTASVAEENKTPVNQKKSIPIEASQGSVARGKDGTLFYFLMNEGRATLYRGTPDSDSSAITLDSGTAIADLQTESSLVMLVTDADHLVLAWSDQGQTYATVCELQQDSSRVLNRENFSAPVEIGTGKPTSISWNPKQKIPVVSGYSPENGGAIWLAIKAEKDWKSSSIVEKQGVTVPQVSCSSSGMTHVVWRDVKGAVWHLENQNVTQADTPWLRSGGTSLLPEIIGASTSTPSLIAVKHQLLVGLTTPEKQIEYSLYAGQSWEQNQALTSEDKRWEDDTLSQPKLMIDGMGVPWLFYVNTTGKREYLYYTRWLGFGWDTIREGRGIFHKSEEFLDVFAPIENYLVPSHVSKGSPDFSLMLVNRSIPQPFRPVRFTTPSPVAKAGTDILFLDMLDVGRSLWTEQKMYSADKHPQNPVLKASGDETTLDSHRVFNGGIVLKEKEGYKAWYNAMNPTGAWFKDGEPLWKKMMHFCYATSPDGINWTKPKLGIQDYKGSKENNSLGYSFDHSSELRFYHGPIRVMPNPDQSNPARKYLSIPPGYSSSDGLKWNKEKVTFNRPGPDPKWVDYHSIIYDPEAPASRRWKAYGCTCTNEPPVLRSICYAYSADGVTWTEDKENPIMVAETGGYWNKVHDLAVCKYKDQYLMLYQTADGYDQHIELATSRDGRNFVRVHDGTPLIEQGKGAKDFDRGMHLPSRPLILEDEIRLYYGAADYMSPLDPSFDYDRWKMCKMQLGLATLPTDGWAYIRNAGRKHVGYVTTVPLQNEDLKETVLTLNVRCQDKGHFMAEILDGETGERVPGYEMENCDHVEQTGFKQVVSWKGNSNLENIKRKSFRVRVIFVGRGDAVRLYSIGFKKDPTAEVPVVKEHGKRLKAESLVYTSSVSNLAPLKSWIAHQPDGKRKPLLVLMHGFGEPVYRHGGRRMAGSVRHYALQGMFAIGVDLRGREESAGRRDNGGLEVMDIYDAVQAVLKKYPNEADPENINILGWSGGGGNTFSAVTRMPDLFSNAAAFYGITDYGYWANTAFKGVLEPPIGGTPAQVPDRYAARNSLAGVGNNAYTHFQFFWDEDETICPVWMDEEYRRIAKELKYDNIIAHESKRTDKFRWLHAGSSRESGVEARRLTVPFFVEKHNPNPQIQPAGNFKVLGYLMTKRFQTLFGQGNDAVVDLDYALKENTYEFTFRLETSDPAVRGWLKVTDRPAEDVKEVLLNGKPHPWVADAAGHILVRDLLPNSNLKIQF